MKLLLVDDHPVVREGLAALLRQAEPGASVLLAGDCEEGLSIAEAHRDLDAVVLDLAMPGMDGMAALPEFGRRRPDLPVIVLSSSEDPRDVRRALGSGALGYVPKSASPKALLAALNFVLAGNIYVPPLMVSEGSSCADIGYASGGPDASLNAKLRSCGWCAADNRIKRSAGRSVYPRRPLRRM